MRTIESNNTHRSSDEFILYKPNSDILSLEELKKRIFLKAYNYYGGCLSATAKHLRINPSIANHFEKKYVWKSLENDLVEYDAGSEGNSIGFYDLSPALSEKFELLYQNGNFRSMDDLLGEIADRAMRRYKTKFQAARKLGIEEPHLEELLGRTGILLEPLSANDNIDGISHESISGEFNPLGLNLFNDDGHIITLEDAEIMLIRAAINRYPKMTEVAQRLGMGRSTLYRKMDEYNIKPL